MKSLNSNMARVGVLLIGGLSASLLLPGQENPSSLNRTGMPYDWSHRHVIFSKPSADEQSSRVHQDVRFWHQHYRRNVVPALPALEPAKDEVARTEENLEGRDEDWREGRHRRRREPHPTSGLKRDWSVSLGPNATVGAGNYPAKFSFDVTTANCGSAAQPDFVVYNTSVLGSGTQASIVAYDNLYTGCGGTVPTTYWSYNTGGSVVTSVVLSLDGSQIAFIQTGSGTTTANLVLLKWKASTSGATSTTPDPITNVAPSLYPTCTAPCMTTLAFSGAQNDTNSSPFYDYFNDALYVGDDNGSLHKFQPVFTAGTPAEVSSGWPVSLAPALKLSSPVYDAVTGRIFVGSGFSGVTGSKLYAVTASSGALAATSASLGKGNGIAAGPIVDSTAGKVYIFVGTDNSPSGTCFGGGPCSGVYQFTASSTLAVSVEVAVQRGSNSFTFTLNAGTFDNNYYTSTNSTGRLYVCGNTLGSGTIFQIPVTAGIMSTAASAGSQLSGVLGLAANAPCSSVSEVFNPNVGGPPGIDRIFVSTTGSGANFCANGCLYVMPVTSWQPRTSYAVGEEILDNFWNIQVVTTAGTSGNNPPGTWQPPGNTTIDNTVTWTCKGAGGAGFTWQPHTTFTTGDAVLDTNGNVEVEVFQNATSGATQPTWSLTIGGHTSDNAAGWTNVGPPDGALLSVIGGTSGIVADNTVLPGTLAGASQIYFSPLGTGFGTCGAGNGCAVQASQAGLN